MGSNKPSTRLCVVFTIISLVLALALFFGHRIIEKEISLYRAPRLTTGGAVRDSQNSVCWMKGTFRTDDPGKLVVSHAAEVPCVYYRYTSETWVESRDSKGETWVSWGTVEDIKGFAHLPLLVGSSEFILNESNVIVKGGLTVVYDKNVKRDNKDYHNKEEIIPNPAEVWVLGIPEVNTIRETRVGLVITMGTIESIIGERSIASIIIMIISFLFLGLAIFLVYLLVKGRLQPAR